MTVLILMILLLETVILTGVFKITQLVLIRQDEKEEKPSKDKSDFWLNIISYNHNNERRR